MTTFLLGTWQVYNDEIPKTGGVNCLSYSLVIDALDSYCNLKDGQV